MAICGALRRGIGGIEGCCIRWYFAASESQNKNLSEKEDKEHCGTLPVVGAEQDASQGLLELATMGNPADKKNS